MALSKEAIEQIESTLKLEKGTLDTALGSEDETTLELPELIVRTKEEDTKFLGNLKTQHETAGAEIAVKKVKNDLGLEFEGRGMDNFVTALTNRAATEAIEAKKSEFGEPNKKIEELTKDNETLQSTLRKKDEEFTVFKTQAQADKDSFTLDSHVMSSIPDNTTLPKEQIAILFRAKHDLGLGENKQPLVKQNGEIMKTELLEVIPLNDVMQAFINDNKFAKGAEGGSGGSDEIPAGAAGTMSHFDKEMTGKNINPGSQEYMREMQVRMTNGTLKP